MNSSLVSIIIPTFNRGSLIGETLDSILAQTYVNWECIVVDDGSTDNTHAIVESYVKKDRRFQYHKRPNTYQPGGNGARNYGFEISKGEYINWFDSDDLMLENFISEKINLFSSDLVFVIGAGYYWYPESNKKEKVDLIIQNDLYTDYLTWRFRAITASLLFKRSFLQGKQLFSDKIIRGQETELFSRLFFQVSRDNYKIANAPLFLYRQHEDTKSSLEKEKYHKGLKKSRYIISFNNYVRCHEAKSYKEVQNLSFSLIIDILLQSVVNKDFELSEQIIREYFSFLKTENKAIATEMVLVTRLLILLKKVGINAKGMSILKSRWSKVFYKH